MGNLFELNILEILDVSIRGIVSLIILFLFTKVIGKQQISQLSLFDYIIGITIGSLAAEVTFFLEKSLLSGLAGFLIFALAAYFVSILTLKSVRMRRFFKGEPVIVVQDGQILYEQLKKSKLDVATMLEECRRAGYFDITKMKYVILEVDGQLSILPKTGERPVTVNDMGLNVAEEGLCANVIIDGTLIESNLKNASKSLNWLKKELKKQGYKDFKSILLASLDVNNNLSVYKKDSNIKVKNVLK